MKSRWQNVSEDRLTITRRITRSKTSLNRGENSLPIPIDLIFEIFSRLPAKSIARCRCVSKFWASILRLPAFKELFMTRSSARPQLLFACRDHRELFLFSLPQLQNSDENSSLVVAPNHLTRFPFDRDSSEICIPFRGLICLTYQRIRKGSKGTLPVICNPTTGQTLKLPKLKTRIDGVRSFLGYDPIGKQFKLLSVTWSYKNGDESSMEYHVLTLGTKKLLWRRVECCLPHFPGPNGIYINGSLYYSAGIPNVAMMILCFDVRSEKFRFIKRAEDMMLWSDSTLVNYNGKLGALVIDRGGSDLDALTGNSRCIKLWVLEDPEKHEWSTHIHVLPPLWKNVVGDSKLDFVGMIGMNLIVLSPHYLSDSDLFFYIYYYNIEKNTIVRVGVQGLEAFQHTRIRTFLNHVENLEFMQAI